MSQNVDTRVVELRFNNSNFEKNVKTSLKSLEYLNKSIESLNNSDTSGLNGLAQAAEAVSPSLENVESALSTLEHRFSTLGIVGMTAVQNLTNSTINYAKKGVNFLTSSIVEGGKKRAKNIEQANFMLEGLFSSTKKEYEAIVKGQKKMMTGARYVEQVNKDANYAVDGTAYGFDAAAKAAAQFAASGLAAGDKMKKALLGVSGTAAMTGASFEEIADIFVTVSGNGKLMTEQLRQFSARGLNVAATLGKEFGKSESQIRDMIKNGEISFQKFANAMANAYGEHAKDANNTFAGAFSNLKAALSRIGASVAQPTYENLRRMVRALTAFIKNVHTGLGPAIDTINAAITKMRIKFDQSIGPKRFDYDLVVTNLGRINSIILNIAGAFGNIKSGVNSILSPMKKMSVFFRTGIIDAKESKKAVTLHKRIGQLLKLLEEATKKIKNFIDPSTGAMKALLSVISAIAVAVQSIIIPFDHLRQTVANLFQVLKNIGSAIIAPIKPILQAFNEVTRITDHIGSPLKTLLKLLSDFANFRLGGKIGDKLVEYSQKLVDLTSKLKLSKELTNSIRNTAVKTFTLIGGAVLKVVNGIKSLGSTISDIFVNSKAGAFLNGLISTFSMTADKVGSSVEGKVKTIKKEVTGLKRPLQDVVSKFSEFKNVYGGIAKENIIKLGSKIGEGFNSVFGDIDFKGEALKAANTSLEHLGDAFNAVKAKGVAFGNWFSGFIDRLKAEFFKMTANSDGFINFDYIGKALSDLGARIITIAKNIRSIGFYKFSEIFEESGNRIEAFIGALQASANAIGEFGGKFGAVFTTVKNVLGVTSADIVIFFDNVKNALNSIKTFLEGDAGTFNVDSLLNISERSVKIALLYKFQKHIQVFVDLIKANSEALKKTVDSIAKVPEAFAKIPTSFSNILDGYANGLNAMATKVRARALLELAVAIGVLAAAMFILSSIPYEKLAVAGAALTIVTGALMLMTKKLSGIAEESGKLKGTAIAMAIILVAIAVATVATAGAVGLLVASLVALKKVISEYSKMSEDVFEKGFEKVKVVIEALGDYLAKTKFFFGRGTGIAISLLALVAALFALQFVLKMYAKLDAGVFNSGLDKIRQVMDDLTQFIYNLTVTAFVPFASAKFIGIAAIFLTLTPLLLTISRVLKSFSKMPEASLEKGFNAMERIMAGMTGMLMMLAIGTIPTSGFRLLSMAAMIISFMVMMTTAVTMIKIIGSMGERVISKGMAVLLVLMGSLALLTIVIKKFGSEGTIQAMGELIKSLAELSGLIAALGALPFKVAAQGTILIASTLLILGYSIKIAGKAADPASVSKMTGMIVLVVFLSASLFQLAKMPWGSLIAAGLSLVMVLAALTVVMVYIGSVGDKSDYAKAIMLSMTIGIISYALYQMASLPVANSLAAATSLGGTLAVFVGAVAILGHIDFKTIAAGIAKLDLIIVDLVAVFTAIGAVINKIGNDAVFKSLETAEKAFNKVGDIIGGFVGSIAKAVGDKAADTIENLGDSFGYFGEKSAPFFDAIGKFDENSVAGIKSLADFVGGSFWSSGKANSEEISSFADSMETMAPALVSFSNTLTEGKFDYEAVEAASKCISAIANIEFPNSEDGLGAFFSSSGDQLEGMERFINSVSSMGPALANLSNSVNDDSGFDISAVRVAIKAVRDICNLEFPEEGGFEQLIAGSESKGLDQLLTNISSIGTKLKEMSTNLGSSKEFNYDSIKLAIKALKSLTEIDMPTEGGIMSVFMGKNDYQGFGDGIKPLGKGIASFAKSVAKVKGLDKVKVAAEGIVTLSNMDIPSGGGVLGMFGGVDSDMVKFGQGLEEFAPHFKTFAATVADVKVEQVNAIFEALGSLNIDALPNKKKLSAFTDGLKTFADDIKTFVGKIGDVGDVDAAIAKIQKLSSIGETIAKTNMSSLSKFSSSFKSLGQSGVKALTTALNAGKTSAKQAGTNLSSSVISGLTSKNTAMQTAGAGLANKAKNGIGSVTGWNLTGQDAGQGYINGILAKKDSAYAAGYALGKKSHQGAKDGVDSNSPSKLFMKLGGYVGEGYTIGILSMLNEANKAGASIAYASQDGANKANDSHSPSLEYFKIGTNAVKGYSKSFRDKNNTKEVTRAVTNLFSSAIKTAEKVSNFSRNNYADKVIRAFAKSFSGYAGEVAKASRIYTAATSSIQSYIDRTYKMSDYYKEDKSALKSYLKELNGYIASKAKETKNIKKYKKDKSSATKSIKKAKKALKKAKSKKAKKKAQRKLTKAKNAKSKAKDNLKEAKKSKKEAIKNINKLRKTLNKYGETIANNIKKAYQELIDGIKDTVKDYTNILSVSFDTGIDIFKDLDDVTTSTTELEEAEKELSEAIAERDSLLEKSMAVLGRSQKYLDELAEAEERVAEAQSAVDSLTPEIAKDDIKESLTIQIEQAEKWREELDAIKDANLFDSRLIEELEALGVDGANKVSQFAAMKESEIKEINDLYARSKKVNAQVFLDTFNSNIKKTKEWADAFTKLADAIPTSVLEEFKDAGIDSFTTMDYFISMTTDQLKDWNDLYKNYLSAPTEVANTVVAALAESNKAVDYYKTYLNAISEDYTDYNKAASNLSSYQKKLDNVNKKLKNKKLSKSKKKQLQAEKKELKLVISDLKKYMSDIKSDMELNGQLIVDGYNLGVLSKTSAVTSAMKKLAQVGLKTYATQLGIKSPSRVFAYFGQMSDLGLANGLTKYAGLVSDASSEVGDTAVSSLSNAIASVSDLVVDEMTDPTITPVLDLTEIINGANQINGMFADGQIGMASSISGQMSESAKFQNGLSGAGNVTNNSTQEVINNFYIQGDNPREIADEVSRIISQRFDRREAAWA